MDERKWIIGTSIPILVFCFGVFACKVLWPWRGQEKGLLARCCHRLRRRTLEPEEEAVERRVREEVLRRRVERAGMLLAVGSLFSACDVLLLIQKTLADTPELNLHQSIILQSFAIIRTTMGLFPKRLTPRLVDMLYCLSIASVMCWSLFVEPTASCQFVAWRAVRLGALLYWSVFDLKPTLNTIGTLSLLFMETAQLVRTGGMVFPAWYAYLAGLFGLIGIDYCLRQNVRFEILAVDSKTELTAAQALLNSICDVVVLLDCQLRLKQHAPKLADVLLQPAGRNLAGADIRDYMVADVDRETFTQHLRIAEGKAAQADVFHARLRDSSNSGVAMEFFTVGFKSHDGVQHIVGMREHTDIQPLARQDDVPPPPPVELVVPRGGWAGDHERPPRQLGTPRALQRGDLNALRADSGSESSDERHGPDAAGLGFEDHAVAPPGVPDRSIETSEYAKRVTLNYLLMSWVLKGASSSCCPKHAALAELHRVASRMDARRCVPDYEAEITWQCRRCGIRADEHRDPRHRSRCLLCKNIETSKLERAGTGAMAAL